MAADLFPVAQPDREVVALAPSGRAEVAPPGGRLAEPAGPGQPVPGPIRHGIARVALLCGTLGPGKTGPGPSDSALITDSECQNSLEPVVFLLHLVTPECLPLP